MPEGARPVRAKAKRRARRRQGERRAHDPQPAIRAIAAIDFSRVLVCVSCAPVKLRVRVADDLVLEAGVCENDGIEQIVHPPQVTLFRQVLDYLRAKPDPPTDCVTIEVEAAAAAAVALRWGSYFAVLADRCKPLWPQARSPGASRISDSEMARINIEASAALAEWIDLLREEPRTCAQLAARAAAYVPMPRRKVRPEGVTFAALAMPSIAARLVPATAAATVARARAAAERYPSRVFANALVNTAWRNGPIEHVHAGICGAYPFDCRRLRVSEERSIVGVAIDRLAVGLDVCHELARERPARAWAEQVLPYGLADKMLITPVGWTLTESTREVRLSMS
jgi:hypothetical protein